MPLLPGSDKATISANIRELMRDGKRPQAQCIAIALAEARRTAGETKKKPKGGK